MILFFFIITFISFFFSSSHLPPHLLWFELLIDCSFLAKDKKKNNSFHVTLIFSLCWGIKSDTLFELWGRWQNEILSLPSTQLMVSFLPFDALSWQDHSLPTVTLWKSYSHVSRCHNKEHFLCFRSFTKMVPIIMFC